MKKTTFAALVLGIIGGLLFSLGLCMCLLPQWNAFVEGVGCIAAGAVLLLVLLILARRGRPRTEKAVNWKLVGKITYGVVSTLVLGAGMSMILVLDLLLWGIVVGVVGILMLLYLIPMCIGLK